MYTPDSWKLNLNHEMDLLYFEENGENSDPLSITNPDYDFNVDGSHAHCRS